MSYKYSTDTEGLFIKCSDIAYTDNGLTCWILKVSEREDHAAITDVELGTDSTIKIKIAPGAFAGLPNLASVVLGPNVLFVGDGAFANCSKLQSFNLTAQLDAALLNTSDQEELVIKPGILTGCTKLASLTIPFLGDTRKTDKTTTFLGYLFDALCADKQAESIPKSLKTVTLTGTTIIRNELISGVQTNVPYIDFTLYKSSFMNCCYLENVYLPKRSWNERNPDKTLTTIDIPDDCFNNCSSLKLLTVMSSYLGADDTPIFDNTLDINSFAGSSSHIGERAFYGCTAIYNVILPKQYPDLTKKGLPRIGVDAFANCYNMVGVYGSGVDLLQQGTVGSTLNGDVTYYAVTVTSTIPEPLPEPNENINSTLSLFNNGWYIEEDSNNAVIFDCVAGQNELTISKYRDSGNKEFDTKIKDYSFNNNQTIKKITIAEGITELGDYAFRNCSKLEEIVLPKTLTTLGAYTFVDCPKLKTVKYRGTFNDWCKINFGAFHQLFANADHVYFNDGNTATAADSFDLPLFYKAENILSPEEVPIESDVSEINSFAFYKFTCNRTFKFTSAQLKIGNYTFANCPNLTVKLADGADISTLGYNAFENSTKSFIKNTNTYNNVLMLSNYTLGSWLMAVEVPQSYKNNMSELATIYNYQFGCSIPKNITNIKEDVYKQANAELSALQAELSRTATEVGVTAPQIIFRTHYSSNIKDWAGINFANSWSNPLYQEYGALGTDKLLMKFYLETFDDEGDPVLTECTEADLSSQVDPYDPTHLIETKINNFAFCGFTFDVLSLLDTTILGDKAFEGAKISTAKVTPNNCIYVANPTLTALEIYSSRFTSNSIISNAFSGSANLTTIAISGNNLKFGANAFLDCKYLTVVKYNNTIENWCKLTFDNKYANPLYNLAVNHFIVNGAEITETITLENVDALRSFTFCNLTRLQTINFVDCANISFDSQWILNCPMLKNLNVQGTIPRGQYTISNNSILKVNDDYTTLIMTTNGTDFTALANIQEIETGAISCLANTGSAPLEIILPDSVQIIQSGAIDRNLGVSRLVIPFLGRSLVADKPQTELPEVTPVDEETSTETSIGNERGEEYLYTKYLGHIFGATTYKENAEYVPSQLKEICITKDTKFEDFAFFDCKYLEAVFTSHELSFIADNAFEGCTGLTNSYLYSADYYRMSDSDRLANETTSRTALYKATTSIFASTNEDLAQLTDFTLSVNYPIYSNAFSTNCLIDYPNIKVTVELNGNKDISIGKAAFRNFKNLVAVNNSAANPFTGTAHIGSHAFAGCTNLAQVFLPDKLSYLGTEAFMNCIAITDLIVPTVVVTLQDEDKLGTNLLLNCNALTNIEMPTMLTPYITKSNLVTVTFNHGTKINPAAFRDCKLLRSVTTKGTNIKEIGAQAFKGCIQLRTINLSSIESLGKEAFMNCINLRNITSIPFNTLNNLYYAQEMSTGSFIASNVFLNCVKLVELKITTTGTDTPDAITKFEEVVFGSTKVDAGGNELATVGRKDAFGGCCSNLQQTELGYNDAFTSKITTIGNWVIFKENICLDYDNPASLVTHLKLPNTINSIYKYAFIANDVIEQLEVSANLVSIDEYAFYSCNNFKELTYNTADTSDFALSTIGVGAFMNTGVVDTSKIFLTKFTKISAILSETFSSCANLTTIMIPKNIVTIDTFAFKNCPIIDIIEVAVGHTTYGNTKLNTLIKKLPTETALPGATDAFAVQLGCKNSSFPLDLNITEIQENAFSGCTGLTAVALPSSLVSIGKDAFAGCSALVEVQFECPELITIGNCAFKGCSSLESVDLSACSKLTTIKTEAFMGCSNLSLVTLPNKISEIYAKAFALCKLQQIYIPRTVENKGTENEKVTGINTMGDFVFMQNPASLIIYCNELPASFLTDASSPTVLNSWKVDWNRLSLNTTQTYIVK